MDVVLWVLLLGVVVVGFSSVIVILARAMWSDDRPRQATEDGLPESSMLQWLDHILRGKKSGF